MRYCCNTLGKTPALDYGFESIFGSTVKPVLTNFNSHLLAKIQFDDLKINVN